MKQLAIDTPKKLPEILNLTEETKYFAIYYQGTHATCKTYTSLNTFSYYGLYEPIISHLSIAMHLSPEINLGSDDGEPTHALLFEKGGKIAIAEIQEAREFLETNNPQLPQLTEEELKLKIEEWSQNIQKNPGNYGMFEMFSAPSQEFQKLAIHVIQDLDREVTKQMCDRAIALSRSGNMRVTLAIDKLMARVTATVAQNSQIN